MLDKGAVRINGVVKDYAWGNPDFIPSLVGGYSGKPQAEYWMGTHRNGEAVLEDGSKLSEYAGHELGFLLKILAIDNPLSIQCHPNKRQATDGWRREAKLRSEGAEVNYQDPNQKAEAFIALTPVLAMCGFQPLSSIRDNLKATVPEGFREIEPHFSSCWELYSALYSLSAEKKKAVIDELSQGIPESDDLSMLSVS
ncbi:MAG: mannose-6-phosphate isomerase, class I, partial [Spirochaetales bacterium]|nr:mannose-6-phosphate isomerase, class I [Spirochaetales bacterium]